MDAFRMIEAPSAIRRSVFCTVNKRPFTLMSKHRVVVLLGDLTEGGVRRDTGVREHNVEPSLLPLDLGR
jgi:hypothetical protein